MGASSSTLKRQHGSTPVIGYSRGLRVSTSPSPRLVSPHARRGGDHHSPEVSPGMIRTTSWHAPIGEQTPLLSSSPKLLPPPLQVSGSHRQLKHHHHSSSSMSDTAKTLASPPIAVWILPALACALSYAMYNIFIKKGSASIHPVLGGVILQFVAALLGVVLLSYIVAKEQGFQDLNYDSEGIQWAICAGIAVGLAEMISFFVSSLGVQAMQSIPIIIGGSVMFGTILGFVLLGEVLSLQGWMGVGLLILGIFLVGTDPAASSLE